jgi:hypothetical protein
MEHISCVGREEAGPFSKEDPFLKRSRHLGPLGVILKRVGISELGKKDWPAIGVLVAGAAVVAFGLHHRKSVAKAVRQLRVHRAMR